MRMFYYAPGPIMWVTPLSTFPTPVPATASYYTVPQYYVPQAAPIEPVYYGMPMIYGAPYATYGTYPCEPCYYPQAAAPNLPRGEYRMGGGLLIL